MTNSEDDDGNVIGAWPRPAMAADADVKEAVRLILHPDECFPPTFGDLQTAAIRVAMALGSAKAEEREACAAVADEKSREEREAAKEYTEDDDGSASQCLSSAITAMEIAAAIRSRKDVP